MNKQKMIYKKLHLRLTILFTSVSSLILIIMSLCYLLVSEKNMKNATHLSFLGEMNSISLNLEGQTIISYDNLARLEQDHKYIIGIYDNDLPLTYNTVAHSEKSQHLIDEVFSYIHSTYNMSPSSLTSPVNYEFSYKTSANDPYYVYLSIRPDGTNKLTVLVLYSTASLLQKLKLGRIRFFVLDLVGILILFTFTFLYTRKMILPLKKSQENQTAFIASASHELRTPLAVIVSSLSAFKTANDFTKEQFIHTIESESSYMTRLINDMLTLTRADNQTWSFQKDDNQLDTLLLDTYEVFEPMVRDSHLTMSIELPDDIVPLCHCDKDRIAQVLAILISNAISYSKSGGFIKLSLSYTRHNFILSVMDNGIGISEEAKMHIFDRFYREDPARQKKNHFGLGLCIAQEIVEVHHGQIKVYDTPSGGTTFCILLPNH